MEQPFDIGDDFAFTDEDEEVLKNLKKGVSEDVRRDHVTGRVIKKGNTLNKRKLSKHEMDEFFLDY